MCSRSFRSSTSLCSSATAAGSAAASSSALACVTKNITTESDNQTPNTETGQLQGPLWSCRDRKDPLINSTFMIVSKMSISLFYNKGNLSTDSSGKVWRSIKKLNVRWKGHVPQETVLFRGEWWLVFLYSLDLIRSELWKELQLPSKGDPVKPPVRGTFCVCFHYFVREEYAWAIIYYDDNLSIQ